MNQVLPYALSFAVSQTSVAPFYVDKFDQLLIEVPKVVGFMASNTVQITLQGNPNANGTTRQLHYFDYVTGAPNTCVITISTGGIYEFPNAGAMNYIGVSFDVAATQATVCYLIAPKGTY